MVWLILIWIIKLIAVTIIIIPTTTIVVTQRMKLPKGEHNWNEGVRRMMYSRQQSRRWNARTSSCFPLFWVNAKATKQTSLNHVSTNQLSSFRVFQSLSKVGQIHTHTHVFVTLKKKDYHYQVSIIISCRKNFRTFICKFYTHFQWKHRNHFSGNRK